MTSAARLVIIKRLVFAKVMDLNINILEFDSIDSTNTYARKNAGSLPLPSLIIAREQTAGRGRHGKSFYSPKGTGIYFTLLFEAGGGSEHITPAAAVAVCECIEESTGIHTDIKWVNDIYLGGRKIAGILCEKFESAGKTLIAAGIGINATTEVFPADIPLAGSLGVSPDPKETALKTAVKILEYDLRGDPVKLLGEYRSRMFILGKEIEYIKDGKIFKGKALDINPDFTLEIETGAGTESLSSGEISLIMR